MNSNKASVWESRRDQAGNGAGGEKRGREDQLGPRAIAVLRVFTVIGDGSM